jgi:hypothetical protein
MKIIPFVPGPSSLEERQKHDQIVESLHPPFHTALLSKPLLQVKANAKLLTSDTAIE